RPPRYGSRPTWVSSNSRRRMPERRSLLSSRNLKRASEQSDAARQNLLGTQHEYAERRYGEFRHQRAKAGAATFDERADVDRAGRVLRCDPLDLEAIV